MKDEQRGKKSWEEPDPLPSPEIVIGLVGPIGVDLATLETVISRELDNYGYHCSQIKLSDYCTDIFGKEEDEDESYDERIERLMNQGNLLRKLMKQQDAMGLLAVVGIRQHRAKRHVEDNSQSQSSNRETDSKENPDKPRTGEAYILHQLKTPQEVNLLRNVYGRAFLSLPAIPPLKTALMCSQTRSRNPKAIRYGIGIANWPND